MISFFRSMISPSFFAKIYVGFDVNVGVPRGRFVWHTIYNKKRLICLTVLFVCQTKRPPGTRAFDIIVLGEGERHG